MTMREAVIVEAVRTPIARGRAIVGDLTRFSRHRITGTVDERRAGESGRRL
jgi:hypothetical protein